MGKHTTGARWCQMSKFEIKVTQQDIDEASCIRFYPIGEPNYGLACPISISLRRKGLICCVSQNGDILAGDGYESSGRVLAVDKTGQSAAFCLYFDSRTHVGPLTITYETVY
jgi:hypothetical protein